MGWRLQWPFRWPITRTKEPLPDVELLRYVHVCNAAGCSEKPWIYRPTGKTLGFCYYHLQRYDWQAAVDMQASDDDIHKHRHGSWRQSA